MRVYLFYDRKTGKVVHQHRQTEGAAVRSEAELLKLVHPFHRKLSLAVLEVDEKAVEGRGFRIDPKKKILRPTGKDEPRGRASFQRFSPGRK